MDTLNGYSKSKAKADDALDNVGYATIVIDKNTNQVVSYEDYVKYGGESGAREHGVLRPEGKEYEMRDGDVVEFMFN